MMALWRWMFPTPEDRIAKARGMLADGRFRDARDEVLDLDRPDAIAVLHEADHGLVGLNLEAALDYGRAGDEDRVYMHMELAENFHHGGLELRFRETRKILRELREEARARQEADAREKQARLMQVDPLGLTGGPSLLDPERPDNLGPDAEEEEARLALLVEGYPAALRGAVERLDPSFARAVLDLDDGRADLALPVLITLPDEEPLVRWERSRAAYVLGDPAAAAKELRVFATIAGGHHPIGNQHTGVLLAQYVAESGDLPAAIRVLRDVRAREPRVGGPLFAQLLEATGALPEAEAVLRDLVRDAPKADFLYKLLARVRLKGGHRREAMAALEAAMAQVCCTPGKCGNKAPDIEIVRELATLYLEDGTDVARGLELAEQATSLREQPEWPDAYLDALVAKARNLPEYDEIADALFSHTPEEHPGRARIERWLAA